MSGSRQHVFSLSTHQFRVRHLQAVCVKKLQCETVGPPNTTGPNTTACLPAHGTPNSFICIIHPVTQEVVLQSDVYHHSHNPQWSLHGEPLLDPIASFRDVIVQVWVEGEEGGNVLHMEWFVSLPALTYLADKQSVAEMTFTADTLLFVVGDAFLCATHGVYPAIGPNAVVAEEELKKPYCDVPVRDVCISYTMSSLYSLHAMYQCVASSREQCKKLKYSIEQQTLPQVDEGLELQCRVRALRQMLDKSSTALTKELSCLMTKKDVCEDKHTRRNNLRSDLRQKEAYMSEELHSIDWKLKLVVKKKRQLLKRRQKLLTQLLTVFPIEQSTGNNMTICGVELNLTDQVSSSVGIEDELGAGLGYTTHTVCLVSSILGTPLRFPLSPSLSHSTVRDDITEKLDEKRVLPLFIRGKDRFYFNYGVFLLNRNIAQLRHHCGMKTEELKDTLNNLKGLLVGRLAGNMWSHPPAKLVSHDRLYSLHRTKDPFKKTHKRVRSAPISYAINAAQVPLSHDDQYLSRSVASYSAASAASSWDSNNSINMSVGGAMGGSMNMLRETSEVPPAAPEYTEYAVTVPTLEDRSEYGESALQDQDQSEDQLEDQSPESEYGESTQYESGNHGSVEYGIEYGGDPVEEVEVDGEFYDAEDTLETVVTMAAIELTVDSEAREENGCSDGSPPVNSDHGYASEVADGNYGNSGDACDDSEGVTEYKAVTVKRMNMANHSLLTFTTPTLEQPVTLLTTNHTISNHGNIINHSSNHGNISSNHGNTSSNPGSNHGNTSSNHGITRGNASSPILEVRETSSGDTVQIISFDKLGAEPSGN